MNFACTNFDDPIAGDFIIFARAAVAVHERTGAMNRNGRSLAREHAPNIIWYTRGPNVL